MQSPSENDKRLSSERTLLGVLPHDPFKAVIRLSEWQMKQKSELQHIYSLILYDNVLCIVLYRIMYNIIYAIQNTVFY